MGQVKFSKKDSKWRHLLSKEHTWSDKSGHRRNLSKQGALNRLKNTDKWTSEDTEEIKVIEEH
jgi:hypothetical protein